jgi:hypothetical protein
MRLYKKQQAKAKATGSSIAEAAAKRAAEKKAEDAKRCCRKRERNSCSKKQQKQKGKRNKDPHSLQKIDLKERMTILKDMERLKMLI